MRKTKNAATPALTAICLNVENPNGGFTPNHSPQCGYDHRDGELVFNPPADVHIQLGITAARPNGLCCMNVCFHHAEYGRDRDGREVKHAEGTFVVSDAPILDSRAMLTEPRTQAIRKQAKPVPAEVVEAVALDADDSINVPTVGQVLTTRGVEKVAAALAAVQAKSPLLDRVNGRTKDKPLLRSELSPKERKLARDLAAAGVICRDETGGRISYYPKFAAAEVAV